MPKMTHPAPPRFSSRSTMPRFYQPANIVAGGAGYLSSLVKPAPKLSSLCLFRFIVACQWRLDAEVSLDPCPPERPDRMGTFVGGNTLASRIRSRLVGCHAGSLRGFHSRRYRQEGG